MVRTMPRMKNTIMWQEKKSRLLQRSVQPIRSLVYNLKTTPIYPYSLLGGGGCNERTSVDMTRRILVISYMQRRNAKDMKQLAEIWSRNIQKIYEEVK